MTLEELYRAERKNNWKNFRIWEKMLCTELELPGFSLAQWPIRKAAYDLETERLIKETQ